uniref:Gt3 n=1 Tax=Proteus penneri TaxID=102862 RepID=A0A385JNM6_9GAMM|nr:gt3 [Proteus penneri]
MSKQEIYLFIGQLCQGGGERVCINLANSFIKKNITVNLIVFNLNNDFYSSELDEKVNLINFNTSNPIRLFINIRKIIKRRNPYSKILSFNYHISFYLSILRKFYSFEYITRSLNTLSLEFKNRKSLKDKIIKILVIYGLNSSKKIISQSNGMKNDLLNFIISPEKIVTINNPINNKYTYMQEKREKREKKEKYILYVGRLSEQKGLEYLLHAFKKVKNEYTLLIIGNGEKLNELKELSINLKIDERVKFLGQKNDITSFYINASLTVLSSIYEGFPNVLLESIACGTPVVSFDCPSGPSEIIINGVNGYLAEYLNSNDLAEKINMALSYNFEQEKVKNTILKFHTKNITNEYIKEIFS